MDKPGYKTTEFWLSLAAVILGAVMASGVLPQGGIAGQVVGGIMAVLSALGYTQSRTNIKTTESVPPPELDIPGKP